MTVKVRHITGQQWAELFYAHAIEAIATATRVPYMDFKLRGTPKRKRTGYREARAGRMLKRFR